MESAADMGSKISIAEADLLLGKLHSESVPVVAYYARDGVKVMRRGVITGVSPEDGLVVADKESANKEGVPLYDYLAVSLGSPPGANCTFWYGDERELPDDDRAEVVEKLGDAVLLIQCSDGGRLRLYFSL